MTLANADSHFSEVERQTGFRGAQVTVRFLFYDLAAQEAASRQDWDKAVELYVSALDKNPNNQAYTIGMRRARFQAGQMHVNRGQKLRTEGKVEDAMGEFQKAIIADPSSGIAIQELKRTQAILQEQAKIPLGYAERRSKIVND